MTYETFMTLAWYREHGGNAEMRQQCEGLISQEVMRIIRVQHEAEARRLTPPRSEVACEELSSMSPPVIFNEQEIRMDASLRRRHIDELAELMHRNSGISTTDTSATLGTPGYHYASTLPSASSSASPSVSSSVGTC